VQKREELAAPGEGCSAERTRTWLTRAGVRMARLLDRGEGFGRVTAGLKEKDLVTKRDQLVREREASDAAADDADGCAKEIAAGCAAVELSEIDLHASGEACG
jgi:hypothetical protein